ncbi:hypothetical protein AB0B30_32665 [Streptomyces narbonensis]|uniref:Uncharacterized protein n=1 Tax=Streptomyces narbonensis TaxID=67333 RepID=A0ABV3CKV5_9ACTN
MTPDGRLAATRALLNTPPPAPVPGQLALDPHLAYEEWPDGTFGGTRTPTAWTPEQQTAHRNDLEAALRRPTA